VITPEINRVSGQVVDSAIRVHSALGMGLLESAYEVCLAHELRKRRFKVQRQLALPIVYDDVKMDAAYKIDLLVQDCVVIELKTVAALLPIHEAQLLSYLKLSGYRLGLLINFNVLHLRDGIKRMAL
jgi:GxxExxY protein